MYSLLWAFNQICSSLFFIISPFKVLIPKTYDIFSPHFTIDKLFPVYNNTGMAYNVYYQ